MPISVLSSVDIKNSWLPRKQICKNEKHAVYATLWYITAHYCLRPWPWILTALVAHLLYPELESPRDGFTLVMREVLPDGARGLLFAAFLGAYIEELKGTSASEDEVRFHGFKTRGCDPWPSVPC